MLHTQVMLDCCYLWRGSWKKKWNDHVWPRVLSLILSFQLSVLWFLLCLCSFCVLHPMFPLSLDCLFLIAPSVFHNVYSISRAIATVLHYPCYIVIITIKVYCPRDLNVICGNSFFYHFPIFNDHLSLSFISNKAVFK